MNQKIKQTLILLAFNIFSISLFSQTPCPTEIGLKDVFVVSKGQGYGLCRDNILHQDVTFHYADIFVPDALISADFDDGNGFVSLFNTQSTINYSSSGEKNIEFRQTFISSNGGPGYTSHYRMTLNIVQTYGNYISPDEVWDISVDPSITWTPPCSNAYEVGSPFLNSTIGGANAYVKYGAGHTELIRPLIFVDGLDFSTKKIIDPNVGNGEPIRNGSTGWDVFIMGSSETFYAPQDYSEFQRYPSQFNDILAASYDIIFLDFKNGSDYIQKNAVLLQELLLQINSLKVADPNTGILHQNVVVGASMGGQIAKYTLAKMEADGISHCSSDYLSFDSPHQGANITMGLQAAAWYFNRTSNQKSLWENLNTPAARQLLIQNFGGEVQNGNLDIINTITMGGTDVAPPDPNLDFNCLRNDFVQTMESLGYPIETRNTSISCGSETAINQGYTGNAHLFKGRLFIDILGTVFNLDLWANQSASFHHTVKALNCNSSGFQISPKDINESNSIFAAESPSERDECFNRNGPKKYYAVHVEKINSSPSFDNAPGCFRSDLFSLRKEIKEILEAEGTGNVTSEILSNRVQQCFMPTMSTLDIDWELNDTNMGLDISNSDIVENNLTPFVDYYAPLTSNLKHVEIDSDMQAWINNQLSQIGTTLFPDLPTIAGDAIYNFGNPYKKHIPAVTVTNGGELRINYPGNTEYGNGEPSKVGLFEARTGTCNNGDILIESDGKFLLGNDNTVTGQPEHRANVYITNGNRVHIKDGGTLRLARGSKLIIESGAILEIDAGANIDLWYNDFWDGTQTVEGSSIKIKDGGELIINGKFNFSGSGFFEFDNGNITTFNAPFELTGNGKADRFIRLNDKATLNLGTSEKMILQHGLIEYLPDSKIEVGISGELEVEHVTFDAKVVENDNKGIYAHDAANINLLDADFNNFWTGIEVSNMNLNTDIFKLSLVYFNNCEMGIYGDLCKSLDVNGAYFTPYDNASTAMELVNVEQVDFVGSVNGFANPLGAIQLKNDLTSNTHALTEFTNFKVNGADITNNEIGINVWDDSRVDILVTNGALIDNNTYGIKADGVLTSQSVFANVTVNRGAQISNNVKGIYIGKGMTYNQPNNPFLKGYGTVEMTCAKLLDNITGVEGEDLWLNIDACLNSGQPTQDCNYTQTNPNHFKSTAPINKLFQICYVDRIPVPIDATGNYWELQANTTVPDYLSIGTQVGAVCGNNPFNFSNAATAPSAKCGEIVIVQTPQGSGKIDCFAGGGGSSTTCFYSDGTSNNLEMNAQYNDAYMDYDGEDYSNSSAKFLALANISDAIKDTYCAPCQHYINIARSRTLYSPVPTSSLMEQIDNNFHQKKLNHQNTEFSTLEVIIFPNPTSGELNIKTNSKQSLIRIIDLHGREKMALNNGLDYQINTQSWAAGIYIIEIMDKITMEIIQQKVVVHP